MSDIREDKAALRTATIKQRSKLTSEERTELSRRICERVEAHPAYQEAQTVLFFMPVRGEVDVLPLLRRALAQGKVCALPRVIGNDRLEFYRVRYLDIDLEQGSWGIIEPKLVPANLCLPDADSVIIMPGAVFGRDGGRIGYGAGYYDRYLRSLQAQPIKIAPAYPFQLHGSIPQTPDDYPVDFVVTDTQTVECHREG